MSHLFRIIYTYVDSFDGLNKILNTMEVFDLSQHVGNFELLLNEDVILSRALDNFSHSEQQADITKVLNESGWLDAGARRF